jgi:hypothetical protein
MSLVLERATHSGDGCLYFGEEASFQGRPHRVTPAFVLEVDEGAGWGAAAVDPGPFLLSTARRDPAGPVARFCADLDATERAVAGAVGGFELTALWLLRATGRGARELAASAPNLFWLLVAALGEGDLEREEGAAWVASPRKQILSRLVGQPVPPEAVRALERIQPKDRGGAERAAARDGVRHPHVLERLRTQSLSISAVRWLVRARAWAGARWLTEAWALDPRGGGLLDWLITASDTLRMGLDLGMPEPRRAIERAVSLASLRALHDRWSDEYGRRNRLRALDEPAMHVPFADVGVDFAEDARFRVLRTPAEVVREGDTMRHCCASYVEQCRRGQSVLVHVSVDDPATLELRVVPGGLRLAQLRGPRNAAPSEACVAAVRAWVSKARLRA